MAEVGAEEPQKKSRHTTNERSPPDGGFDCEFIDQPPRRSQCPICLLVPRDPQQTPCCGKAFCKACISKIREKNQPCPTCKAEDFHYFPDKGLQQELYSSKVYCANKFRGCDWEGELRELELHLNTNPDNGKEMEGCKFQLVNCSHCQNAYLRREVTEHQNKECGKRPFTCPTCKEYESTYDDVLFLHQSICKCRPVDCPNKCGQLMQHQKLEEHLSSECDLSEVECEFSHAGCVAKILRRDLPSHMTDNMAAHMSLLAKQNRRLMQRITELELQSDCTYHTVLFFQYPWKEFVYSTTFGTLKMKDTLKMWYSKPFCYNKRHQLQLCVWCTGNQNEIMNDLCFKYIRPNYNPNILVISTSIKDIDGDATYFHKKVKCTGMESETVQAVKISNFSTAFKLILAYSEEKKITFIIDAVEEIKTM